MLNIALKALRKLLLIPSQIIYKCDKLLMAKAVKCIDSVQFLPGAQISNMQNNKSAIQINNDSVIQGQLLVFAHAGSIEIGESCYIGLGSRIWSDCSIKIGNNVLISHNVNIHDNNSHSYSAERRRVEFSEVFSVGRPNKVDDVASAPIVIEDDVWIGFNATILKGIRIGKGSVIGANSMVIHSVPPYSIVAGMPAKIIGIARP
jgi:acetyltransferase-like isoleucine patch superfamily enzyme